MFGTKRPTQSRMDPPGGRCSSGHGTWTSHKTPICNISTSPPSIAASTIGIQSILALSTDPTYLRYPLVSAVFCSHGTCCHFNSSSTLSCVPPVQQASSGSHKMTRGRYYACIPACGKKWEKPGSLNRHQNTCKHWRAHEEMMLPLRREAADARRRPKKRAKLALNEVLVPLVIFSGNSSDYSERKPADHLWCQPQRTSRRMPILKVPDPVF